MEQAANNGTETEGRAADGTFATGNKIGKGKPRGKELATRIREAVDDADDPSVYAKILGQVQYLALNAVRDSDRIAAVKLLIEWRIPVTQAIDVRVAGPMTEDELQQALSDARQAFDNR